MPTVHVSYNAATRVAYVNSTDAVQPGYKAIGNFQHPDPVYPGSLVVYHGVRDLLYHEGVQDMGYIHIEHSPSYNFNYVTAIRLLSQRSFSLRLNDESWNTARVVAEVWPPAADNKTITIVSANPAIAEVGPDGLLTAKSAGDTEVTITAPGSVGGTLKIVVPVTVGGVEAIKGKAGDHTVDFDADNSVDNTIAFKINPADATLTPADIDVWANTIKVDAVIVPGGFTVDVTGIAPIGGSVNVVIKVTFDDGSILNKEMTFN